jgi:phosphopantetheinyl transferase (holo-ACP synthase)
MLALHGSAAALASVLRVRRLWVSLSHTQSSAGAVVVIESD